MKFVFQSAVLGLFISIFANQGFAQENPPQIKAFEACVATHLLKGFMPSFWNAQDSYSNPGTDLVEEDPLSLPDFTAKKLVFVPGWSAYARDSGYWETHNGNSFIVSTTRLDVRGQFQRQDTYQDNETRISMDYSNTCTSDNGEDCKNGVAVKLSIHSGLPFLTVEQTVTQKCTVDAYGRESCEPPVTTYANFQIITPSSFQPKLKWVNEDTGYETKFEVDAAEYKNCLSAIR